MRKEKIIQIKGINFSPVRYPDVLEQIEKWMKEKGQHLIVTANPEMVVDALNRPSFKILLNQASLVVPDGIGILWAAYYLSLPHSKNRWAPGFQAIKTLSQVLFKSKAIYSILPQRVTGADLLFKIIKQSEETQAKIFFLGAAPGVAHLALEKLKTKYPQANLVGSFPGTPNPSHEDELCELIKAAQPDILFVAYGSPAQEEWIERNLKKIPTVKVAIGVGGAIDFAAEKAKRAPKWMQKLGLEWLWRLLKQPHRFKRIWTATVVFVRMITEIKNND